MCWKPALGLALGSAAISGPVAASFQQITFVWLAGVALAYHLRSRSSLWAGIGLGIASMTKFLPLLVLGYFVFQRKFRSVIGAAMVWAVAISGLLVIYPPAFTRYFEANHTESFRAIILRIDNISIFTQAYHILGVLGIVAVLLYVLLLVVLNRQPLFSPRCTPEYSFFLYSFLSVLLLPICWGYSLVPLLPVIGYFFAKGRGPHILVASGSFLQLAFLPPFGSALAHTQPLLVVSTLFFMSPPVRRS
jgi:hypothetical protein